MTNLLKISNNVANFTERFTFNLNYFADDIIEIKVYSIFLYEF